jgi:hypothetical protein
MLLKFCEFSKNQLTPCRTYLMDVNDIHRVWLTCIVVYLYNKYERIHYLLLVLFR